MVHVLLAPGCWGRCGACCVVAQPKYACMCAFGANYGGYSTPVRHRARSLCTPCRGSL